EEMARASGSGHHEAGLLAAWERERLARWNETEAVYPAERSVAELFAAQAEQGGERIALVYEDEVVSYGELNRRANQLAHYLMARGVGAETLVGVCLERSVELVVGLLGILKAGGAYVPLDPEYPAARLEYMLADAGIKVLVTTEKLQ